MQEKDTTQIDDSMHKSRISTSAILITIGILVIIIIGMFIFTFLTKQEILQEEPVQMVTDSPEDTLYPEVTRIDATHYYINGVHTFVGEVELPTPCDLLETQSSVAQSMPERITLDFTVLNNSDTCIQQITQQRFKISARASVAAQVQAIFMGRPIELNLIPAREGEVPEDFELFMKG